MKLKIIIGICFLLFITIYSCQSDSSIEFDRYYSSGSVVYQSHCQNCHGAKGEGLSALIPPLTDSVYLKTNKTALACLVQHGLKAPITVSNKTFDGQMPSADLTPIEIAQLLTYVTNSFGNKMGIISADQVQGDLDECKQ